jgi:hypothetical protein
MIGFSHNLDTEYLEKISNYQNSINNKLLNTTFGELRVATRTNLIDIKSIFGLSLLRDKDTQINGATITNRPGIDSEYNLLTTTNTTSKAVLETKTRGRYVAGIEAEVGLAIRLPNTISGNGFICWGYYDDNDGYGFLYNSNSLNVFIRKNGTDNIINHSDFNLNNNLNKLNGEEALDLTKGNIFNISITWYGYGDILFKVNLKNIQYNLHRFTPTRTSCNNPNLPLKVEVDNNGSAESLQCYLAGRQFSHLGNYFPNYRLSAIPVFNLTIPTTNAGSTNNYTPIMSVKRKSQIGAAPINIENIEVITNNDIIISVFGDTTLDGNEIYGDLPDISVSNTCIQYDTSANDFTGSGIVYYKGFATGTQGNNNINLTSSKFKSIDLSGDSNITLCAKALNSQANVDVIFTLKEEW